jgi:hypothetical protein
MLAPRKRMTTEYSIAPPPIPTRTPSPTPGQINRNIELLEPPVSHCKQRAETKINRNISAYLSAHLSMHHRLVPGHSLVLFALTQEGRAPQCGGRMAALLPSLRKTFPSPGTLNRPPSQINRHTFLLEIAVTYAKQRAGQILIETRNALFPPAFPGSQIS